MMQSAWCVPLSRDRTCLLNTNTRYCNLIRIIWQACSNKLRIEIANEIKMTFAGKHGGMGKQRNSRLSTPYIPTQSCVYYEFPFRPVPINILCPSLLNVPVNAHKQERKWALGTMVEVHQFLNSIGPHHCCYPLDIPITLNRQTAKIFTVPGGNSMSDWLIAKFQW